MNMLWVAELFVMQNVIVLAQNLACVWMLWAFRVPRVKAREIVKRKGEGWIKQTKPTQTLLTHHNRA